MDIGIAMGRSGTDVAREVADVVLEEDNLETLVISVRDGRTIHHNVRKSVHFFLSTNLTEIMIMFFPPLRNFLRVPRLNLPDILVIGATSVLSLVINELIKKRKA